MEALQILGGSGELKEIREVTYNILEREGKLGYIFRTGRNLYQQRWTLELLKEKGFVENGDGFWKLKDTTNIFNLVN
jgi:hypothetical protein